MSVYKAIHQLTNIVCLPLLNREIGGRRSHLCDHATSTPVVDIGNHRLLLQSQVLQGPE